MSTSGRKVQPSVCCANILLLASFFYIQEHSERWCRPSLFNKLKLCGLFYSLMPLHVEASPESQACHKAQHLLQCAEHSTSGMQRALWQASQRQKNSLKTKVFEKRYPIIPAFHWWLCQSNSLTKLRFTGWQIDLKAAKRHINFVRITPSVWILQLC